MRSDCGSEALMTMSRPVCGGKAWGVNRSGASLPLLAVSFVWLRSRSSTRSAVDRAAPSNIMRCSSTSISAAWRTLRLRAGLAVVSVDAAAWSAALDKVMGVFFFWTMLCNRVVR